MPNLLKILGDEFEEMPISEREKLVFQILNEDKFEANFSHDVRYEDIMNVSNSK